MFMPKKSTGKPDELGHVGFNAGKERKKALRMLAIEMDFANETELLKFLIDEKVKKHLPGKVSSIESGEKELKK